jgi:hypothetical protein
MSTNMQSKITNKPASIISGPAINRFANEDISAENHYSVSELAALWHLSEKTIRRMFENEPGVIIWGVGERRFKRGYRTLRIPETVVIRVHRQLEAAG